ncbi:uncharacterized protein PV06_07600 [Exophiala oligosperma]|uniref:Uncharacterized protein n=2 Tax=Chaetothyriales TaxID=34395 RepID=A0A0D2AJX5_9EURO|nr:uncharacterized protein PV06_07600 [Exophiala oligosperma]KAJ9625369.1 hypothetical protein H2204_010462 [Knufia peltigerae]KIW40396.1 hypothetical protein PV06_07600 [Exophiala oligosperma]
MALFAFLDTLDRGLPSERPPGYPKRPTVSLPSSRNNSTTSINSLRSEPGWTTTSMNGVDRGRSRSTSSSTSSIRSSSNKTKQPSNSSGGGGGGFGQFFKSKKDKKDTDRVVVTSQHAAAVRAKLARDPKYDKYRNREKDGNKKGAADVARMVGTPNTLHLSAEQQEMRHPHSGPPALSPPVDKSDLPVLDRVISGDEVDDVPDQWERMRHEWKLSKVPDAQMLQVIEGEALESGASSSGTSTPREVEVCPPVSTEGDRHIKSWDEMWSTKERPKPQRRHTPIGGRYTKDERGVWKK